MLKPIKTAVRFTFDTLTFGSARRSVVQNVGGSAGRLSSLFLNVCDRIGQRNRRYRHESFQEAMERLNVSKEQLRHVYKAMRRMQRTAICMFVFLVMVFSAYLGCFLLTGKLIYLIPTLISAGVLSVCYTYALRYGLRRWQIEQRKLCWLSDYLRQAGYIHPLLW